MSAEKTTTIRMDTRTLKRIDGIARAMSRSRAWVINEAIERNLDYEEWFVGAVKRGLKGVETGELLEHEAVVSYRAEQIAHALRQAETGTPVTEMWRAMG